MKILLHWYDECNVRDTLDITTLTFGAVDFIIRNLNKYQFRYEIEYIHH